MYEKNFCTKNRIKPEIELYLGTFAFLRNSRIPLDSMGARIIFEALKICILDERYLDSITKNLYYELAKRFGISIYSIEKNIRTAIEKAWEAGMKEFFIPYGVILNKRPGNAQFLKYIVLFVKLDKELCTLSEQISAKAS